MDYIQARKYMMSKPEASEDWPFGPDTLVLKVKGKIFAILFADSGSVGHPEIAGMNLKCDPDQALALRDIFDAIVPGYHMNKKHWNTVVLNGSIPDGELERMIDHSYALVVKSLGKARKSLELNYSPKDLYGA